MIGHWPGEKGVGSDHENVEVVGIEAVAGKGDGTTIGGKVAGPHDGRVALITNLFDLQSEAVTAINSVGASSSVFTKKIGFEGLVQISLFSGCHEEGGIMNAVVSSGPKL